MRWLAGCVLTILVAAAVAGGYFYWLHEAPRATGPLAQDLITSFDPDVRRPDLRAAFAAHVDPALNIEQQLLIFLANGFDCSISPVQATGSQYLTYRRPIEGRHYCDQLFYYVYQTAQGAIVESLATTVHRSDSERVLGRCTYEPFPDDGRIAPYPHDAQVGGTQ
ncbi:hypothetical protein SAMN06295905_3519 [Devosia lucknowensis]|uniref:Uncharacterized protein n=1 Tax=Devosia lucknowensis TaxID=1096929 RepID=A0A1Y6G7Y0_9HYPH|nr:hypothetical protein [Devosia lucknowensis]SMQ86215.1 hypothetical protein SAMN06295905_3519 [Devosia lucknowensis]